MSAPDGSEAILQWKHKWISNSICSTRAHYLIGIDDDVGAPAYNEYKFVMEPNLNNASLIESTSGCRI